MSVDLSGSMGYSSIIGKDHTHVTQSILGKLGLQYSVFSEIPYLAPDVI